MKTIGNRVKKERKETLHLSQEKLAQKYHISRNKVIDIEKGVHNIDYIFLLELCRDCNCDIGYLLGEYDCRTGRVTDLVKETGLSENAIDKLLSLNSMHLNILSLFLENDKTTELLHRINALKIFEEKTKQGIYLGNKQETMDATEYKLSIFFNSIVKEIIE